MKGRPETNIENPNYIVEMVEVLANLTDPELEALTEPRTGLHTLTRYLPTPADVYAFLRERQARLEAVRPASTTYRKLDPDDPAAPWNLETDAERKRRHVEKLLGYQPDRRAEVPPQRIPPTEDEVRAAMGRLKTPPAPPSKHLLNLLEEQGYEFPKPDAAPGRRVATP